MDTLLPTDIREKPEDGCYIYGVYLEGNFCFQFSKEFGGIIRNILSPNQDLRNFIVIYLWFGVFPV